MGAIVFHAGMGKAGSSSIQSWLARDLAELRERGIALLVARPDRKDHAILRLEEYGSGRIHSNRIVRVYEAEGADRHAVVANLIDQLDAEADRRRVTVITAEATELLFWRGDDELVAGLDELGRRHEVRVAYYVRPQHTALEANWRQWGFRSGQPPSEALASRIEALHYFDTYASVRRRASSLSFEPRPFRSDLLDGGDPATDFARTFLGLDGAVGPEESPWSNRGLPLEIINALGHAPAGLFWSSMHDNARFDRIKELLAGVDARDGPRAARSRLVLQAWCHQTFEPGNARLIDALGWSTEAFVPPVEGEQGGLEPHLSELDELWAPAASEPELQALFAALAHAISPPDESGEAPATPEPERSAQPAPEGRLERMRHRLRG